MKTLLAGIAAAATLGVMSGAAMQPDLAFGPRPAGPQYYAGGDVRVAGPFEDGPLQVDPAFTSTGKVPDHVYGTDWLKVNGEPMPEPVYDVIPARPVFVTYNDPPPEPEVRPDALGDAPAEAFAPATEAEQAAAPAAPETASSEDLG